MTKIHLWKNEPIESNDRVTTGVTLEKNGQARRDLWYRVPSKFAGGLSDGLDPFVVGALFTAMRESCDIVAHGEVSRTLLSNLDEFIAAWSSWLPQDYSRIEITADKETEDPAVRRSDGAVATFSGGVDGAFTVYRHHAGLSGRSRRDIKAGLFVHGLDIPLEREDIYGSAAEKAELMLKSLGIDLITMVTNIRKLDNHFRYSHGAEIASCLLMLENGYSYGMIASTESYVDLTFPWGSNVITDRLLSSGRMEIIHDGTAYTRSQKIEIISNWVEALRYLRVCWQSDNLDRNCCKCEKCIRTILNMRVLGIGLPDCFEHDVTDGMISGMKGLNIVAIRFLEEILDRAEERSIKDSWVPALKRTVKRNMNAHHGWRKRLREARRSLRLGTRLRGICSEKGNTGGEV